LDNAASAIAIPDSGRNLERTFERKLNFARRLLARIAMRHDTGSSGTSTTKLSSSLLQ
jgi:hypothetical protein